MTESQTPMVKSDSLDEILNENPHSWWRTPLLWRRWRRAQFLYQDFSRMRVGLNDYERELLMPQLRERVKHMAELFAKVKETCTDPGVRQHIGPAITALGLAPTMRDPVTEYLGRIDQQIDTFFLAEIARINQQADDVTNMRSFIRFANSVHFLCSAVLSSQKTLFWYSSIAHLYVTERGSGTVVQGEPKEFAIILMPFKNLLENLVNIAAATDGTIKHWKQQQEEGKKPFLEYLSASAMHSANRITVMIQILTILVAVLLSAFFLTAADPFSLKRKNVALTERVQEVERSRARFEEDSSQTTMALRQQLRALQSRADALASENGMLRADNSTLRRKISAAPK